MQYKKLENTYIVRVEKGEEAIEKLTELCEKENIKVGSITAIGATNRAELLWYDPDKKEYSEKTLEGENYEVTSFIGNITRKNEKPLDNARGKPYLHCHIVLGDRDFKTYAGHCKSAIVSGAFEAVIEIKEGEIGREHDESVGLNLLKF
ncbi:DNA-binding protein [bacterium]|nr:DNA-binding protein [bacterium]|tara:strand:+ start:2669 stop:3115 length:447 start_codon:yes stop_codon:yes gene_type:complete